MVLLSCLVTYYLKKKKYDQLTRVGFFCCYVRTVFPVVAVANTYSIWASLIAQLVKNLPAMQDTPILFLGWEDPLEKG